MNNSLKACEVKLTYRNKVKAANRPSIKGSKEAYDVLMKLFYDKSTIEHREFFKVILLNRANKVLGVHLIAEGGINEAIVDIRLVMQSAILANASSIILSHNHPSGNCTASTEDKKTTLRIKKACEIMDIKLLDHIILTATDFYSFADEGVL